MTLPFVFAFLSAIFCIVLPNDISFANSQRDFLETGFQLLCFRSTGSFDGLIVSTGNDLRVGLKLARRFTE
jgi:hypothetical protein